MRPAVLRTLAKETPVDMAPRQGASANACATDTGPCWSPPEASLTRQAVAINFLADDLSDATTSWPATCAWP